MIKKELMRVEEIHFSKYHLEGNKEETKYYRRPIYCISIKTTSI